MQYKHITRNAIYKMMNLVDVHTNFTGFLLVAHL